MNPEQELVITPEIKDRLNNDPYLMASFHLGRLEKQNGGQNPIEQIVRNENREQAWLEFKYGVALQDLFFTPTSRETWLEDTVNFATPEEIEHEFAFYLGANYINSEEYSLLLNALEVSKFIHANDKRRDGLRRSLYGHLLPGLRVIFDNRGEIINDILEDDGDDPLNFFESVFTFIGHDWLEDIKDSKFEEYIDHFPPQLKDNIKALTHSKGEGVSIEEYAKKIAGSKRVIKFVKMLDKMMNHIDDIGKAPVLQLNKYTEPRCKSRHINYLEETEAHYSNTFKEARLPLFDKFEEVVERIKSDDILARDYFRELDNIVKGWIPKEAEYRKNARPDRYEHIVRIIENLQSNAAEYGVVNSIGMIGAIFIHDFIMDNRFLNKLRWELRKYDIENPPIAELLRYSMGVAYSARSVENKAEIQSDQINKIYNLKTRRDLSSSFKDNLKFVFRKPPENESISNRNKRLESFQYFSFHRKKFFELRPSMGTIPEKAFRETQRFDIEGLLLIAMEMMDKIDFVDFVENRDPTYQWRQLQESMYLVIPLLESFGLKGMARSLTNKVEEIILKEIVDTQTLGEIERETELIKMRSGPIVRDLKTAINRSVAGSGVIEFDEKGLMGIINKLLQPNRTVVTDLNRCRVVLPEIKDDEYLLLETFEVIEKVILEFNRLQTNKEEGEDDRYAISIGRPFEPVDGEKEKLAVRISIPESENLKLVARDFEAKMKVLLGIPAEIDLVEFVPRKTKYRDVKVVFMINNETESGDDPVYYEMIITDSSRHKINTFGAGARVYKFIVSRLKSGDYEPPEQEISLLQEFYMRSAIYAIMSTKGFYSAEKSREWLKDRNMATDEKLKGRNIVDRFKGIITKNSSYIFP